MIREIRSGQLKKGNEQASTSGLHRICSLYFYWLQRTGGNLGYFK